MKKILNGLKVIIVSAVNLLSKLRFKEFFRRVFAKIASSRFGLFIKSHTFQIILVWLGLIIMAIQIFFGVLIYGYKSESVWVKKAAMIIPFPIAIANQDFITYNEYLNEKTYIHHFYATTQQSDIDYGAIDKEIISQLIDNKLIAFQAYKNRITVNNKEIDDTLNQIVEQNGGQENVNKVLSELYGIDLNQFRELVRTQLLREKVNNELIMRVSVSHILIRVEKDATQDKVDAAKAKIDGIKKEIDDGLDFAEAAKKYSEDTGSAEAGGKLDPFADGEMVPEFSSVAFNTLVGKISDPVRTEFGWHIIKVESKTGKIQQSFNDWLANREKKSLILRLLKIG